MRCRNTGAECVFQESRVGKVPGIRAKRNKDQIQKQMNTPAPSKHGFPTEKVTDSISVSTEARLFEQSHECEQDPDDTMSWATDWQLEPSATTTFDLLDELDSHAPSNISSVHPGVTDGSSGSGFVTTASSEESYMLSPTDANLEGLLMFQLATPIQTEPSVGIGTSAMPMSLGLLPRSERDSQCCLECCQMINDLENYIMAELKAFKILLGIIRRALGKLAELISSQHNSKNLRCIMLFTTLLYQILELLETCLSTVLAETSRQQGQGLSGGSLGFGFGDFTIDAEEQSAFRTQSILKEVQHAIEVLSKLRSISTWPSSNPSNSDLRDMNQHSDHCLDLEMRFKALRTRIQRRGLQED
jgi:hypothetical protein